MQSKQRRNERNEWEREKKQVRTRVSEGRRLDVAEAVVAESAAAARIEAESNHHGWKRKEKRKEGEKTQELRS